MKRAILVFFLLALSVTAFAFPKVHQAKTGVYWVLAACDEAKDSDQAKAKLRRLLACDSAEEACRILRPLFSLINSRGNI